MPTCRKASLLGLQTLLLRVVYCYTGLVRSILTLDGPMTKILALKASILHHVYTFVCWLPSADHVQSTRYDIKSRAYHMLFGGNFLFKQDTHRDGSGSGHPPSQDFGTAGETGAESQQVHFLHLLSACVICPSIKLRECWNPRTIQLRNCRAHLCNDYRLSYTHCRDVQQILDQERQLREVEELKSKSDSISTHAY